MASETMEGKETSVGDQEFAKNASPACVDLRASLLGTSRRIVDMVFGYTNHLTDVVEKFCVSVDARDEFLFPVKKLSP